jgi:ATP-dependent DNA helicase RecQ
VNVLSLEISVTGSCSGRFHCLLYVTVLFYITPYLSSFHKILKDYWGHDTFRPVQLEIIESVMSGKDTLALLPTGGGKSVCFQVPALSKDGICIVVTPLIALMKDQTAQLKKKNIPALCIYSGMPWKEIDITLDRCIFDTIKFLYVSPERLKTEVFQERVKRMKVNFIAVDEAHCISQWGYDFRPSYLEIASLRTILPGVPVIALTASATLKVTQDIQEKLLFHFPNVFRKSFVRENLSYSCFSEENKEKRLLKILNNVPGSAVVYVRSRKKARELALLLNAGKIDAGYYHAGLALEERFQVQHRWLNGTLRVIVATNAFGMGIDKPDVRSVIHMDMPESTEAYYQEAGRAGRDGIKSYAILLFNPSENDNLKERITLAYPEISRIRRVYQALANYYKIAAGSNEFSSYDFDVENFSDIYQFKKREVYSILKILQRENFILLNDSFYEPSKIFFLLKGISLYEYQVVHEQEDALIKALLRMYGGEAFSSFVTISENKISSVLSFSEAEVERKLTSLHKHGVLIYNKKKDKPQLTYLTQRYDAAALPINIGLLQERKKTEQEKMDAILYYCQQKKRCRTIVLVEYFGEVNHKDCGICDVCIQNKKKPTGAHQAEEIQQKIMEELSAGPLYIEALTDFFTNKETEALTVVRTLIDRQELAYDEQGKLMLKNKRKS